MDEDRATRLDAGQIEHRLTIHVDSVLRSGRSLTRSVQAIARFDACAQHRFLDAVERISGTSTELAYSFSQFAVEGLALVAEDRWEPWVLHLLDVYDRTRGNPVDASVLRRAVVPW